MNKKIVIVIIIFEQKLFKDNIRRNQLVNNISLKSPMLEEKKQSKWEEKKRVRKSIQ